MNDREVRLWMIRSIVGAAVFTIVLCTAIVVITNSKIDVLITWAFVGGALTIATICFGLALLASHRRLCALEGEERDEQN